MATAPAHNPPRRHRPHRGGLWYVDDHRTCDPASAHTAQCVPIDGRSGRLRMSQKLGFRYG
eukprot:3724192-Prymnesium_polylepis.1